MRSSVVLALAVAVSLGGLAVGQEKKVDLRVHEKVLDNGFRILVVPRPFAPRVACGIWFRVGSCDELPGKTGLAHVLEHMTFKGSHRIGVKDAALGEKIAAQLDALWERKQALAASLGEDRIAALRAEEEARQAKARELWPVVDRVVSAGLGYERLPESYGKDLAELAARSAAYADAVADADASPGGREFRELREIEPEFAKLLADERKNDKREELWDLYVQAGGTDLNAFTSEDTTCYVVTLPRNKLELFFWLETDRLTDPVFREWYPERDVVKQERRISENSPDGPFYEAATAVIYGPHPYGHPILGWMPDLDRMRRIDAEEFFRRHYVPENATCVLVGDVDPEAVFALASRYLGRVPKKKADAMLVPAEPVCPGEKRFAQEADSESRVEIYWPAPTTNTPDFDALTVATAILGGETGRLHESLVVDQALATTVEAGSPVHRFASRVHVAAHARAETDLAVLESALLAEVSALTTKTITAEEMTRAKNRLLAEDMKGLESLENIADKLGSAQAIQGDWRRALDRGERIASVTPERVKEAVALWFGKAGRTVCVLKRRAAPEDEPDKEKKSPPRENPRRVRK